MSTVPVAIREPRETDMPFLYNSFIKSLSNQKQFATVDKHLLSAMLHSLATRLLKTGVVKVACDANDTDQVFGWICYRPDTLLWVYVKNDFRRYGVGTILMREAFGTKSMVLVAIPTSASRHLNEKWKLQEAPWALRDK